MKTQNVAALYCRVSRDDEKFGDSASIETQKSMLSQYAESNGFAYNFYIDDGYSGTTFDRPGFNQMIADIQDKKIDIVITKDLSRLGRDYLKTGYYIDLYFDENNVRYIAINDSVDSANGNDEFIPFRNIINEWHSRDLSRKVKSAYRTKSLNGEFTAAYAPYGYMKNPENKHQLIIDENTSINIKRIFQMAAEGVSSYKIAMHLANEKVLTPRAYIATKEGKYKSSLKHPTDWSHTTIETILRNREYLGHLVCNKSTTKSFKNRKLVRLSKENWIEVKNTHESIVDEKLFESVQKITAFKDRKIHTENKNIFAGLLRCADCGNGLTFVKPKNEGHGGAFNCNLYRKKATPHCSAHYITYNSLYKMVLDDIKRHTQVLKQYENELISYAYKSAEVLRKEKTKYLESNLSNLQKRYDEIYIFIEKLFEKNALSHLSDEQFSKMLHSYENEKKELLPKIKDLQKQIDEKNKENHPSGQLEEIIRRYTDIEHLSAPILRGLIHKIIVHNTETVDGRKHQQIEILYKFAFPNLCSSH